MKCAKCETTLPDAALFCWRCGLPQSKELLINYYSFLNGINQNFHHDFLRFSQLTLQSDETPIVVADWSYIFWGSDAYFGYLVITTNRYISISFEKSVKNKKVIDTGIPSSKLIAPDFSPLTDLELSSRHIIEIPLAYITSIQKIECLVDDERLFAKKVFRFVLGTPENNDLAFGTRFFLYHQEKANKIEKTICHYNPNVKYSYEQVSI